MLNLKLAACPGSGSEKQRRQRAPGTSSKLNLTPPDSTPQLDGQNSGVVLDGTT
jgi:hypothetical protein